MSKANLGLEVLQPAGKHRRTAHLPMLLNQSVCDTGKVIRGYPTSARNPRLATGMHGQSCRRDLLKPVLTRVSFKHATNIRRTSRTHCTNALGVRTTRCLVSTASPDGAGRSHHKARGRHIDAQAAGSVGSGLSQSKLARISMEALGRSQKDRNPAEGRTKSVSC